MRTSKFLAVVLAATLGTTCHAQSGHLNASETSLLSGSIVVALPFSLVVAGSHAVGQSLASIGDHSRWKVKEVKAREGGKADARMQSEDGKCELTMTVLAPTVREQRLAAGDMLDIDRVGTTGYVVKKGTATIGVLVPPGGGAVHSRART